MAEKHSPDERRAMEFVEAYLSLPPEGKRRAMDVLTGMSLMVKQNPEPENKG